MIRDSYDVIVVGAGPAGSTAAQTAAEGGASVLLLEKDRDVGIPVRCAEAVGRKALDTFIEPDPHWVAHELNNVRFTAPDGTQVDVKTDEIGYILNRRIFDQELARRAAKAGARVVTRAYVFDLLKNGERVEGVRVKLPDGEREIRSQIVIGADGVESRVGRWAGLRTQFVLKDFETCYQVTLGGISVDATCVDCHFGNQIAPGGYAWIFPKGKDVANVGLGISADKTNGITPQEYLERFIERLFPNASVLACVAGGVPAAKPFKKIHGAGFMLAGDAAAHANPLTGGGITKAIAAGRLAGEVAAASVREGDSSEKRLAEYTRRWEKRWGDEQRRLYRIKEAVHKIDDETFNRGAHILAKMQPEKRTLHRVFATTLAHHPKILIDIAKSFLH
jgi:digeranylgeranylglycerophospholipid reductase